MSVRVGRECFSQAADTLARSFLHSAYPAGAICDDERRLRVLERIFLLELERVCGFGDVVADSCACRGVAIWFPLRELNTDMAFSKHVRTFISYMTLSEIVISVQRYMSMERERESLGLPGDTLYLTAIGVAPEAQGQGIGSSLLREKFAECDRDGVCVYLETNTERNVGYYESFGFSVLKKVVLEDGAFTTWYMFRRPKV